MFDDNQSFQVLSSGAVKLVNLDIYGSDDTGRCATIIPVSADDGGIAILGKTNLDNIASFSAVLAQIYAETTRCEGDLTVMGDAVINGGLYPFVPLDVSHGGTGATDAAVTIGGTGYSTILNGINAVRSTRIFPISMRKTSDYCTDAPSGCETDEANIILIGNSTRITATLYLFAKGSGRHIYVRDFYNGSWFDSQWTQIH